MLAVEGPIDQNELWKGQSTTMRLPVVGSEERLPLRIVNKTPATIAIDGGVNQLVDSAGGADNALTRSVRGIMKGNFNIEVLAQPAGVRDRPAAEVTQASA